MLTIIGAWFGGIWSRIGGWLALAGAAVAVLWVREHRAEQRGKAEAKREQEIADGRAAMDRVRSDETVRRAGADDAREQLRRDWSR